MVGRADGIDSGVCGDEGLGVVEGTEGCCAGGRGSASETNSITEKSSRETITRINNLRNPTPSKSRNGPQMVIRRPFHPKQPSRIQSRKQMLLFPETCLSITHIPPPL